MRFHEHNSKDVHNSGSPRSLSNDLARPRHSLVFLIVAPACHAAAAHMSRNFKGKKGHWQLKRPGRAPPRGAEVALGSGPRVGGLGEADNRHGQFEKVKQSPLVWTPPLSRSCLSLPPGTRCHAGGWHLRRKPRVELFFVAFSIVVLFCFFDFAIWCCTALN